MADTLGNASEATILHVEYPKATIDKINFTGFNTDNAWTIAENRFVHKELQ